MHILNELITAREVAERLQIDRSAVTRMVQAGRLTPIHKLPGTTGAYLFDPKTIATKESK